MTASILKSSGKTLLALCLLAISSCPQAAGNVSYPSTTMPGYETDNNNGLPAINSLPTGQQAFDKPFPQLQQQNGRSNQAYPQRNQPYLDDNGYELNPLNGKPKLPPFADYVQKATEQTLPIFGSKLFRNPYNNFESADGVQVNPDYVIGNGDQLQIKGWGMVDIDLTMTVDRNGGKEVAKVDLYAILVDGDKSEDQTLRDGDVIQIPAAGPRVALLGDVKIPAIYEFRDGDNVGNLLHWAGGLESAAEGKELWIEKSVNNRFLNLAHVQNDDRQLSGIALKAGDIFRLHVPGAQPVSVQKNDEFVSVGGEVGHTGTFQIQKGETLRQLIMRLGGVNDDGYVFATQFKRESIRQMQQQKLDEVSARFEKELEQNAAGRLGKLTDKDAIASVTAEVERQRQIAAKMREIKAEGRVVLEMKDANAQVKDLPDLELQDGDQVEIPRRPGTVNVLGAVYQSNAFIYRPQRSVSDYLTLAGGVVDSGDKSSIYVLRADGTVASSNNGSWFSGVGGKRINPGDTIVVPEELNAGSWTQSLKEWTSILYQFGLGAAGLKVLK